jgi:acyl-CoA synthetase (AMP-forming)/AMP-acid ligase II
MAGGIERERIWIGDIIEDGAEDPWRQKVVDSGPNDIAMILYTSGTTGESKGVTLTHQNLISNADSIVRYLRLTADDRVMVILPFCYAYGNSLLTTHMRVGGSLVLENSFSYPNIVLDRMRDEEVTGFSGVPSSFALLLNRSNVRSHTFQRLRYLTQAGGAMSPKHIHELRGVFPGKDIYIMYGQTEATARLSYLEPADLERKPGSIGKAIPSVSLTLRYDGVDVDEYSGEVRRGKVGEIVANGDNIMAGYWNNPVETAKVIKPDGLHTGDLGRVDDEGYFYIVGRQSEIIKSGAYRISPKEIEEVILECPGIHEAAVIGTPDDILGEMVVAYIVAKPDYTLDSKEILTHCWKQLPPFKVPRRVEFIGSLPKNPSGKVRKQDLAAICLHGSK